MATQSLANIYQEIPGDFNVGRGSLGRIGQLTMSGNITLWTTFDARPHRYMLDAGGADRTVTLPVIGTASGEAAVGHTLVVMNTGATNTIELLDSGAGSIATLSMGQSATVTATVAATTWEVVIFSTGSTGVATLQTAYDNSTINPEIVLSTTRGAVEIANTTVDTAMELFVISDNGGGTYANDFMVVENKTGAGFGPAIAFGGASTGGAGSFVISDGSSYTPAATTSRFAGVMSNGFLFMNGTTEPGNANADGNMLILQGAILTTDGATYVTGVTIPIADTSTQMIEISIAGAFRADTGSSIADADDGWIARLVTKVVRNDTGTSFTIDTISKLQYLDKQGTVDFDIVDDGSSTGVDVEIRGLTDTTIRWGVTAKIYEMYGPAV